MRRALLLTALLGLTLAAPANASTDWLPIFEKAAIQQFGYGQMPPVNPTPDPGGPRCNHLTYQWVDDDALAADHADAGYAPEADSGPFCVIRFATSAWHRWSLALKCLTVVHEIGHQYGLRHDDDPDSVMYEGGLDLLEPEWWLVPACRASMRRVKMRSARGFVWWALRPTS